MNEPTTNASRWSVIRKALVIGISLAVVIVGIPAVYGLLHDRENVPLCHSQAMVMVSNWFDRRPGELPNVEGRSNESLTKLIENALKQDGVDDADYVTEWTTKYQYVPGLRRGDPGDLLLMFMKKPTRWRHHATTPPSIFSDAQWMIVPLDFARTLGSKDVAPVQREIPYPGECSERVSLDVFKSRLRKTLKFLQDNDRPHWQTAVAENESFLSSLETD
jgi:hypothetical protein